MSMAVVQSGNPLLAVKRACFGNREMSTHGPNAKCHDVCCNAAIGVKADAIRVRKTDAIDPEEA